MYTDMYLCLLDVIKSKYMCGSYMHFNYQVEEKNVKIALYSDNKVRNTLSF